MFQLRLLHVKEGRGGVPKSENDRQQLLLESSKARAGEKASKDGVRVVGAEGSAVLAGQWSEAVYKCETGEDGGDS